MRIETHINNIIWNVREMRLADYYKLFLWDFDSKKAFFDSILRISTWRQEKIFQQNIINMNKKWRSWWSLF